MRNAAQHRATKGTWDLSATVTVDLPSTGAPVPVGVYYDGASDSLLFAHEGQIGNQLSWQAGGYALVINFFWSDQPFPELFAKTPACWFASTVLDGSVVRQTCCVPPVPGWYHIAAEVPDASQTPGSKKIVDPVIVVTPIITP